MDGAFGTAVVLAVESAIGRPAKILGAANTSSVECRMRVSRVSMAAGNFDLSARGQERCHPVTPCVYFLFKLGLARPAPSQPHSRHRFDGGDRQMNPSIQFDTGGDCDFRVPWEDGDRIFCR